MGEQTKKRKDEDEQKWQAVLAMGSDEIGSASAAHVSAGTEKLTRRNMKICVSEHIQEKCEKDLDFARKAMHPQKSMVNCFRYINKKALEFIKQGMEDNHEEASRDGFGGDVPDDLCYEWAVDYFSDMDAEVDKSGDEEFVPKPFYGGGTTTKKTKKRTAAKKPSKKAAAPAKKEAKEVESNQISLLDVS